MKVPTRKLTKVVGERALRALEAGTTLVVATCLQMQPLVCRMIIRTVWYPMARAVDEEPTRLRGRVLRRLRGVCDLVPCAAYRRSFRQFLFIELLLYGGTSVSPFLLPGLFQFISSSQCGPLGSSESRLLVWWQGMEVWAKLCRHTHGSEAIALPSGQVRRRRCSGADNKDLRRLARQAWERSCVGKCYRRCQSNSRRRYRQLRLHEGIQEASRLLLTTPRALQQCDI